MISMDKKTYYPELHELLNMPVSVRSWIVLKDYAFHFGNLLIFQNVGRRIEGDANNRLFFQTSEK